MPKKPVVYFDKNGIKVTSSRIVTEKDTYAVGQIIAVRTGVLPRPTNWLAIVATVGVAIVAMVATNNPSILMLIAAVVATTVYLVAEPSQRFFVAINTASGNAIVLTTHDCRLADEVADAIDEAIDD